MRSFYQPKRGGSIEVVSEKAASEIVVDLNQRADSSESVDREEEFINEYIQQNAKRIQVEVLFSWFIRLPWSFRVRRRVRWRLRQFYRVMMI